MRRTIAVIFLIFVTPAVLLAATAPTRVRQTPALCGSMYSPPFADPTDAGRRKCGPPVTRTYARKYGGIGFEALDLESEACFVPDTSYRLLDDIIDAVLKRVPPPKPSSEDAAKIEHVLRIGQITGDVLAEKGFGLFIPTPTLGDALAARNTAGEPSRHIVDCDASSLIVLTVAEALATPASLVDVTLPGGSGHNYVRWQISADTAIDWDTNGRAQCTTPPDLPTFEGKSMTHDQTLSYVLTLRVPYWVQQGSFLRALADYREAISKYPQHPFAYNNLAWLIATKDFPRRRDYTDEAVRAADKAVSLSRIPNYLDTLACTHALAGDFAKAVLYAKEAVAAAPGKEEFANRLAQFEVSSPKDCTGAD